MVSLCYILTLFLCNALKWIFSFVRRWLWSCFHILIKSACTGFLWITEIIVKWQNSHMLFYIAHLCTCAIKVCAEDSVKSYFVENEIIKSVSCGSHNRICNYNYWSIRSQFSGLQGMRTAKKKGAIWKDIKRHSTEESISKECIFDKYRNCPVCNGTVGSISTGHIIHYSIKKVWLKDRKSTILRVTSLDFIPAKLAICLVPFWWLE